MQLLFRVLLIHTITWSCGDCILQTTCYHKQFQCHVTKKCINRDMVRNKKFNCGFNDTSDEDQPLARCHAQTEHRCRGNGQCVPRGWINRAIPLCADFSDQGRITGFPCGKNTEFRCSEGNCISRREVMNGNINCSPDGNDEVKPITCNPNTEFRCSVNGRCILRNKVLDRLKDCPDSEDENASAALSCGNKTGEFQCENGRCIQRHLVGDGIPQCKNGEDENLNLTQCLPGTEFACLAKNKTNAPIQKCISISQVNDGLTDCKNGDDESVTSLPCDKSLWSCDGGTRCLTKEMVCDGLVDCQDCSDEMESDWCPKYKTIRYISCSNTTGANATFSAIMSSNCILRSYFCDGIKDCRDGGDEREIGVGLKCRITKKFQGDSKTRICVLPHQLVNDGITDCDDGSDELVFSSIDNPTASHVTCLSSRDIKITKSQVCSGVFDCPDLTDECLCEKTEAAEACDNVCYYENATNQQLSDNQGLACATCTIGFMLCDSTIEGALTKCIPPSSICDYTPNCIDLLDEKFCNFGAENLSYPNSSSMNSTYKCPLVGDLNFYYSKYSKTQGDLPLEGKLCDGVPDCFGFYDECGENGSLVTSCKHKPVPMFCEHLSGKIECDNSQPLYPWNICNGRIDCQSGIDEAYCNDTQYSCNISPGGLAANPHVIDLQKVSIERSRVCDGHVDCDDQSDELNCSNHFYCLYDESPLFISRNKVLDGHKDCSGGSDECPDSTLYSNDPLSSRDHLIRQWWLRCWLWLVAVAALLGNLVVMAVSAEKILTSPKSMGSAQMCHNRCTTGKGKLVQRAVSPLSRCNDILVFNLSLADFLTGIYLMAITIKSYEYAGSYCRYEYQWRTCDTCRNIGVLLLTSCQASVGIMATLTTYRLYAVVQPWKVASLRISFTLMTLAVVWTLSVLIAVVPILPYFRELFTTATLLATGTARPLYFSSEVANKTEMVNFLTRSCSLYQGDDSKLKQACLNMINHQTTWNLIESDWSKISSQVHIVGYFGYFSSHGVCMPMFYPIQSDFNNGKFNYTLTLKYTTFVLTLDFVLFLYIAFAYSLVSFRSMQNMKSLRRGSNHSGEVNVPSLQEKAAAKRIKRMHKRIGRLVVTDFICWIPTCTIAFFGISGHQIPAWVYSFTAVVLLPINSALNPILYSDVLINLFEKLYNSIKLLFCRQQNRKPTKKITSGNNSKQSRKLLIKIEDTTQKTNSLGETLDNKSKSSCFERIRNLFSTHKRRRSRSNSCGSEVESLNRVQHTLVTVANMEPTSRKTTTL